MIDYVLRKALDETENSIWKCIWQTAASTPVHTESINLTVNQRALDFIITAL